MPIGPDLFRPTNATEFWTLVAAIGAVITGLATVALVIVAKLGLASINLARKDIVSRATREALSCTVTQSLVLAQELLPERWAILNEMAVQKVPVFVKDADQVTFGAPNEAAMVSEAKDWLSKVPAAVHTRTIRLMNRTEAWAMYFVKGLADAGAAAPSCAAVYCSYVMQVYPFLVDARASERSGRFPNTVALFEMWYGSHSEEITKSKAHKLLQQLGELQAKGRAVEFPRPLGTDLD